MQLAHPKVAQPKLGAYSAPSLLLVSSTHPARMPDGPAKKPGACPDDFANYRSDTKKKKKKNDLKIFLNKYLEFLNCCIFIYVYTD